MINLNKKQLIILIVVAGIIIFVVGGYIYSLTSREQL